MKCNGDIKLGEYTIIRELIPGKSFLAHDPTGRNVFLKSLPPDCLLEGQLNPTVADRLRRVREIAMTDVANLRSVERVGEGVFLVWDYVQGAPFDSVQGDSKALARQLIHTVEHLHATGLVHGALHPGNVLVDPAGAIKLIDISPLLFLDPKRDERAVVEMCRRVLPEEIAGTIDADSSMQELSARLGNPPETPLASSPRPRIRRRTLLAALLLMVIGVGAAVAIHRIVQGTRPTLLTPPCLFK